MDPVKAATEAIVAILLPLRQPEPPEGADVVSRAFHDPDSDIRRAVRDALIELGVYNAGGCPLCLS